MHGIYNYIHAGNLFDPLGHLLESYRPFRQPACSIEPLYPQLREDDQRRDTQACKKEIITSSARECEGGIVYVSVCWFVCLCYLPIEIRESKGSRTVENVSHATGKPSLTSMKHRRLCIAAFLQAA